MEPAEYYPAATEYLDDMVEDRPKVAGERHGL